MPNRFFSLVIPWAVLVCWIVSSRGKAEPMVAGFDRFYGVDQSTDTLAGQLLLTELSCTACHAANALLEAKRGPSLQGLSSRLQADWVAGYLQSPEEF
jgi:cytochrome c2